MLLLGILIGVAGAVALAWLLVGIGLLHGAPASSLGEALLVLVIGPPLLAALGLVDLLWPPKPNVSAVTGEGWPCP